mgnify:CR=1 FL=1
MLIKTNMMKKNTFQFIFEQSGVALLLLDQFGTIVFANEKFSRLSGFENAEIQDQKNILDFFGERDQNKIKSYLVNRAFQSDFANGLECFLNRRDGATKDTLLVLNDDSASNQIIATIIDVTAFRKRLTHRLRSQQHKFIANLASGIAHEIRNPLSAINTSVEILADCLSLSSQDEKLMDIILEENKRLAKIMTEFSYFARLKAPELRLVSLNELIQELFDSYQEKLPANIQFTLNLAEKLPSIYGDHEQLRLFLKQLIDNAIEAMGEGGALTIKSKITTNNLNEKQLVIIIEDTGVGISDRDLPNITRPFYSTKDQKLGMGLTWCERIIENHFGEIKVQSKVDTGTQVKVFFPIMIPSEMI